MTPRDRLALTVFRAIISTAVLAGIICGVVSVWSDEPLRWSTRFLCTVALVMMVPTVVLRRDD